MTIQNSIKTYKYYLESVTINSTKQKWRDVSRYTDCCFERECVNVNEIYGGETW